jgi:hypothetical protein
MIAKILENGDLEISLERGEKTMLRTYKRERPDFDSDLFMYEWFMQFIGNSEYEFTRPEYTGALTDAPMLGIYGKARPIKAEEEDSMIYFNLAGAWEDSEGVMQTWVMDVLEAWAFMDYQVISVQQRLLDTGKAVFQSGNPEPKVD